ncbi:MAG: ATP-binding protein [Kiritimatiellia bacterium]|jgi:predicted AAA+ superfamily ATPase
MVGMKIYPRIYTELLRRHLAENRQMALMSGPRQVGKTTVCLGLADVCLNWDNQDASALILKGPAAVASFAGLQKLHATRRIVAFDEIHRYTRWKTFLKGFFDVYGEKAGTVVTGSSRLDVYKRGGDSLMGRYFLYRMHPFSVAELISAAVMDDVISPPRSLAEEEWEALWTYGGFPEPFVRRDARFSRRWQNLRQSQLLREDVRELTRIQEIDQLLALASLLASRSGQQVVYASLAREIRVSENAVRAWIGSLSALHHGFLVRPWHRSVAAAIRKEPKWFLRDWSCIEDPGQRAETLVACHLLKAVEGWIDMGEGQFELFYIRDKQKREVDFVVARDRKPWFLVEVKLSDTALSPSLDFMQRQIGCRHAFQVVMDEPFVKADCFSHQTPVVVPARTFLSQLI